MKIGVGNLFQCLRTAVAVVALAPAIAGVILVLVRQSGGSVATHGDTWSVGYGALYFFGFGASLLGSVLVTRIRSVE